jgi:hypothetical protein
MLSYHDSVWEDDISLLLVAAPDRIGAAACITTGDTLEVTKPAKMRQVLFVAGGYQSFGFNLFCTRSLDPNPKHSESPFIMF